MNEQHKYRSTDKMSDLICDNYSLLMVMSRFGLSLGFGDKNVKDVCEAQGRSGKLEKMKGQAFKMLDLFCFSRQYRKKK